jgi:hypothetical protein
MNLCEDRPAGEVLIGVPEHGVDGPQESHLGGNQQKAVVALIKQSIDEPGVPSDRFFQLSKTGILGFQFRNTLAKLEDCIRGWFLERFRRE